MDEKLIIKSIRDWLDDELVSDAEIDCISDGTGDIVRGRKELAVALIDRLNAWQSQKLRLNGVKMLEAMGLESKHINMLLDEDGILKVSEEEQLAMDLENACRDQINQETKEEK
jgi:hypothetical protein|tara:strand:- start:80 stop:421 length:342 start_codon:yes stop_codon:yes gene_type:complete